MTHIPIFNPSNLNTLIGCLGEDWEYAPEGRQQPCWWLQWKHVKRLNRKCHWYTFLSFGTLALSCFLAVSLSVVLCLPRCCCCYGKWQGATCKKRYKVKSLQFETLLMTLQCMCAIVQLSQPETNMASTEQRRSTWYLHSGYVCMLTELTCRVTPGAEQRTKGRGGDAVATFKCMQTK